MNWKNTLRWIGVLPAMVGGILVGSITIGLLSMVQAWFIGAGSDSGFVKLGGVFAYFAGGALAVYWGTKMAPNHRKVVGAILTGIIIMSSVAIFIFLMHTKDFSYFWEIVRYLAFILGAGYVMHQIYEQGEEFDLFK